VSGATTVELAAIYNFLYLHSALFWEPVSNYLWSQFQFHWSNGEVYWQRVQT